MHWELMKPQSRPAETESDSQLCRDVLDALLDVGLSLREVLLDQHGSDELVHVGPIAEQLQLLQASRHSHEPNKALTAEKSPKYWES